MIQRHFFKISTFLKYVFLTARKNDVKKSDIIYASSQVCLKPKTERTFTTLKMIHIVSFFAVQKVLHDILQL